MPSVIVRPPSKHLADGELTHIDRVPVDIDLARRQWDGYVDTLANAGFEVTRLPELDEHADGVFVEDTVVVVGDTAIISHPGAPSRRGEVHTMRETLAARGMTLREITEPGTLDGGDVLKVDRTIYVGLTARTNEEGIRQFASFVEPLGYSVVTVPVTAVLHLKSAITALPDGTIVGYPPSIDDASQFERFLAVPESEGKAVVVLGPNTVLMSASAPQTAELFRSRGLDVITAEITEFEKLEGCVTCLSVRIR